MRRLTLRTVVALTVPAVFATPSALAEYSSGPDEAPAAIALFSDENFYGDIRDVYDPFGSLSDLAFNDDARSVAVFAGQWELCEHKNFTGRCVFITEDVSDLGWFGLAGRVTSVRPVYEYTQAAHGLMFTRDRYGYIRYAHEETYGYDRWNYGYASSWGISVSHFGYSPDYYRYGYYSPTWGYDPYGFAWGPRGTVRYSSVYRRHPRPLVLNAYWTGWDWRPSDWRHGHWSWRDGRHGDDWRDWRRGDRDHRDGRGGGGRDGRPDDDDDDGYGGRGGRDDRPTRDVPGDRWGPGEGGTRPLTPIPDEPRTGRGGRDGRDGLGGAGSGSWTPGGGSPPVAVTPPADPPQDPRLGRGGRGSDPAVDTSGLFGGPEIDRPRGGDDWRGRGRSGDDDSPRGGGFRGRSSEGGSLDAGGTRDFSPPSISPPPPPPPPAFEERRESGSGDGEARRGAGRGRRDGDE